MRHILLTGASGFLGWEIVKNLLKETDAILYLLARSKRQQCASERIDALIRKDYKSRERKAVSKRIEVIEGDIMDKNLGIRKIYSDKLYRQIDTIYHCAALCKFGIPWEHIKKVNIDGTRNMLDFAMKCRRNGQFGSFHHISTIAVAGKTGGVFYEDDIDIGQEFNNTYERSKFEAEKLVERYRKKGLNILIYRPSIVTGNSVTGEVSNFRIFYQPLHIFSLGLFDEIPGNASAKYDLAPIDYVAKAVYLLSTSDNCKNRNFHLSNPNTISLDTFLTMASSYFGFKKPIIVPEDKYDFRQLQGFRKKVIEPYIPYFNRKDVSFKTTNFNRAINGKKFSWPTVDKKLLFRLFRYCVQKGYI